ncbi:hypothetical protein, partial [Bacillus cereus group sp. BC60]|uniref:hypothetical protein n=1 Tax=Bacillus cereus group sp. BC60 TaxID=3445283 RepID=UPI003F1E4F98
MAFSSEKSSWFDWFWGRKEEEKGISSWLASSGLMTGQLGGMRANQGQPTCLAWKKNLLTLAFNVTCFNSCFVGSNQPQL